MSAEHDAAGRPRRASVQEREGALEQRLRALATDLDDEPAPDFRAATRARLVAMAAVRAPEPSRRRSPRRAAAPWRARLTAAAAGVAMAVTALGTLVALSGDAQPGEVLYGVKRGTEQTQLALAGDERGLTLLEFATTRLQELDALVAATGTPSADLVRDTLATMDAQTTEGAALVLTRAVEARDAAPLTVLGGWARQQGSGLSDLRAALPAGSGADGSIALVEQVGTRAAQLQTALTCPTGPATAGADALGPLPGECGEPTAPSAPAAPAPDAADPGTPAPETPAGGQDPAVPSVVPPPAGTGGPGTSGPTPATPGGGSPGSTGPAPVPTPGGTVPQAPAPTPGLPVPPLPVPGGTGSTPGAPPPTPGPLLDTPLPICVPWLLC